MKNNLLMAIIYAILLTTGHSLEYSRQPAGNIYGARSAWISATTIQIGVGHGENTGIYWEISPTDPLNTTGYSLTNLTATPKGAIHYLYIDRTNSPFPAIIIKNSTTPPIWSENLLGWYSGIDRCIGAVWVNAAGEIEEFICPNDQTYLITPNKSINFSLAIPTTYDAWTLLDIAPYSPVNASEIAARISSYATSVNWTTCRVGIRAENRVFDHVNDGVVRVRIENWLPFKRGIAKKLEWMAYSTQSSGALTDVGYLQVSLHGYRLEAIPKPCNEFGMVFVWCSNAPFI